MIASVVLLCCLLILIVADHVPTDSNLKLSTVRQRKNCDEKCYPAWKGREVAEKCKGIVVNCEAFILGMFRPGKQCQCGKPKPSSSPAVTPSPMPSTSSRPNPSCKGYVYEFCQAAYRRELLEVICEDRVAFCRRTVNGTNVAGVICQCPPAQTTKSPSPSVSPKCTGGIFNNCFTLDNFSALKKNCPDGVSGCPRYVDGKQLFGIRCRCVPNATPSPKPSTSSIPTTPRPECITTAFNMCFSPDKYDALQRICPGDVVECKRKVAGLVRPGFQCKCKASPSPSPSSNFGPSSSKYLKCPVKVDETTNIRQNVYYVDVKKSNACFNIVYSFFNQSYGMTVTYEGKTLRRLWINSRVFAPLKLCIYGKSSIVKIVYNIVPKKKIYLKVSCAYKSLSTI